MATTKYILEKIRMEDALHDLSAKSDGENVSVTYNGMAMTLASALASIYTSVSDFPTGENIDGKISAAIDALIDGAPETYDTLKEIADYIAEHQDVSDALTSAIGNKVDKVSGKGLSTEDFTTALKNKLDAMASVSSSDVSRWNNKADQTVASQSANGLMSASDKIRLDTIRGVRYGTSAPDDMQNGELFVHVISGS